MIARGRFRRGAANCSVREDDVSMKKFFALACVFTLAFAAAAFALTVEEFQARLESAKSLDLSDDNLSVVLQVFEDGPRPTSYGLDPKEDARAASLLRCQIRLARLLDKGRGRFGLRNEAGPAISYLCGDADFTIDGLVKNAVEKIVRPLQLEPLIRELPRYYNAVVNTTGWRDKFAKFAEMTELDYARVEGSIYHNAGFPNMEDSRWLTMAPEISLKDGTFQLYGFDGSVENWLYSFWLRRWQDGTMDAAKAALDLLGGAI